MDGFFVLLVIGVIAYAIVHTSKQRKKANDTWTAVARQHGMRLSPAALMSQPSMRGHVDGYLVSIDTVSRGSGKNSKTYTRYRVHYEKIGVKLRLTREVRIVSAIGKMFGGQDHEIGDPSFDDKVVVRAPSEARAREYLTEPRRRAIEKFLSAHKHAVITESNATFETYGLETRAAGLDRGVRLLVDLAGQLEPKRAAESAPPRQRAAAAGVAAALGAASLGSAAVTAPRPGKRTKRRKRRRLRREAEPAVASEPRPPEPAPPDPSPVTPPAVPEPPQPAIVAAAAMPVVVEPARAAPEPTPEPQRERIAVGAAPEMPDVPAIDPDASAPAADEGHAVSGRQQEVCEALFVDDGGLSHARDVFEADYDGLFVHWKGELKAARHYYSDMTFGNDPGTRAEVAIARVKSGILGDREVVAVVQLPDGADTELKDTVGSTVTFEGDLAKVDPFMRQIFVRNAKIVS